MASLARGKPGADEDGRSPGVKYVLVLERLEILLLLDVIRFGSSHSTLDEKLHFADPEAEHY
jgi:hypothetical protein